MVTRSDRVMSLSERIRALATIDAKTGSLTGTDNVFMELRPDSLTESQLKDAMTYRADFIEAFPHVAVGAHLPVMQKDKEVSALTATTPLFGRDTMSVTTDRTTGMIVSVTEHSTNPKASTLKELSASIRSAFLDEEVEEKEKKAA